MIDSIIYLQKSVVIQPKKEKNVRNVDDFWFAMVSQILAISKNKKKYVFNFGVRTS